jgi:hypothetical protein
LRGTCAARTMRVELPERETLRYFATELIGLELQPGQDRLVSLLDADFERLRTVVIRKGRCSGMTACAALVAAWCATVLAPRFRGHLLPGEDELVLDTLVEHEVGEDVLRALHDAVLPAAQRGTGTRWRLAEPAHEVPAEGGRTAFRPPVVDRARAPTG